MRARIENGMLKVQEGACPNLLAEMQLYRYDPDAARSEEPLKEKVKSELSRGEKVLWAGKPNALAELQVIVSESELPWSRLQIEITERLAMAEDEISTAVLAALRVGRGSPLAIDFHRVVLRAGQGSERLPQNSVEMGCRRIHLHVRLNGLVLSDRWNTTNGN